MNPKDAEAIFYQLVLGMQSNAWMMMGKVANPFTGKVEKNLEAAKGAIDTLLMLKEKTVNNLSKEETELLQGAIQQLEVNYVAEVENSKNEPEDKSKDSESDSTKEEGMEKESQESDETKSEQTEPKESEPEESKPEESKSDETSKPEKETSEEPKVPEENPKDSKDSGKEYPY